MRRRPPFRRPQGPRIPTGLDDYLQQSGRKGHVMGSWGFDPRVNFTMMGKDEVNVWYFEQVFNFLRAMFGLVVPDSLELTTYNAGSQVTKDNLNQMTFLDQFMLLLKDLKEQLWVCKLNLNIVGFLRTENDPDNLVRLMIQEPASFTIWGGPDESGFQSFAISYNLFSQQKLKGEHEMLWSLNQPLLENGIRKWERQSGRRIEVVKGNSDDLSLDNYGFSSPAPHGARPRPPKEDFDFSVPADDSIPDLGDLNF